MPATTILRSSSNPDGQDMPDLLSAVIADIEILGADLRERGHEAAQTIHGNNAQVIGALRLAIQHFGHTPQFLDAKAPAVPLDAVRTAEDDEREAQAVQDWPEAPARPAESPAAET